VIGELVSEVSTPLRGLVVAISGVLLTYLWYHHHPTWAVVIGVGVCAVGFVLDAAGKAFLPNKPVLALWCLEGWMLVPAALAAVAGAVVILLTVKLAVPDGTATSTKGTISALSTGITAFITATFISWAGDAKDSKVADHVRTAFWAKYSRADGARKPGVHYFRAESPGEQWVYADERGGIEGWGRRARARRARAIAAELKTGNSEPTPSGG
jgi:hypothetical protein